ncbi:hypothetical protein LYSHEL_13330 [Lysobacter helvus]|uniref:Uncharacterized protein n=1 Tax=Lysobacter helvus TaxID=2675059 RepID=A0ABN6G6A1_9GAMM|nr:hypothetical protein LYSHEL_13330 [Lysobacter helvus]
MPDDATASSPCGVDVQADNANTVKATQAMRVEGAMADSMSGEAAPYARAA